MTVVGTYYVIYVNDMDRATAFYKDALGAHVGFSSPEWTSLSIAGTSVGLHAGADTNERIIGFGVDVDDLDAACSAVTACGGRLIDAPQELPEEGITIAKVADTEGNVFSMTLPGDH